MFSKRDCFIYNAKIITPKEIISRGWIIVKNGKIHSLGNGKIPKVKTSLINVQNNFLSPGFIDLHIHGDIKKISSYQARFGTTSFLLSLHADNNIQNICDKIKNAKSIALSEARCLGFHLEGPFLNKTMAGAQPQNKLLSTNTGWLKRLLSQTGKNIKIMTLSAEDKGSLALIKILKDNKIIAALGHSMASYEQAEQAISAGAIYGTHIFNRMGKISSREPGLVTAFLIKSKAVTEVIADTKHVHVAVLKLLLKSKSKEKIVLVTDSVAAMDRSEMELKKGVFCLKNGTIAGSKLTMIQAVRNMVTCCGVSVCDAVMMGSLNPAKAIGISRNVGSIEIGKDADFTVFDKNFKVRLTISRGAGIFNSV